MKLDSEIYTSVPSLLLAFNDGKLAMCEEIRSFIHHLMVENKLNPFRKNTEFEEGQLYALSAIIQGCTIFEESQHQEVEKESIIYDA
jgi:hypothetical protein